MNPYQAIAVADQTVQMTDVLDNFGHPYKGVPGQCPCPVHKGGQETRFSAKLFEDNFIFCYTCGTQYKPTQVFASLDGVSREEAAIAMLEKWPPDPEVAKQAMKNITLPKQKPIPQAFLDNARTHLLKYKMRVPLSKYRKWAVAFETLGDQLREVSDFEKRLKLDAFKRELHKDLEPLTRS